jgi:hypothetical protein
VTRFVIDTNVFVSALIGKKGSAADQLVRAFVEDKLEVVASPALLTEWSGYGAAKDPPACRRGPSAGIRRANTEARAYG